MFSQTLRLLALVAIFSSSLAQIICDGVLSAPNPITTDISVPGGSCTIQGITITGSVSVSGGATLTTEGDTIIQGGITASGSGDVTLGGTTNVFGEVKFGETASKLSLGPGAIAFSVSLSEGANFVGEGMTGSIGALNAGSILLEGGKVTGGGIIVQGGSGTVKLCGANVDGEVKLVAYEGNFEAGKGNSCADSTISGSVVVEKGTGDVVISGGSVSTGDLIVTEQKGDVQVVSIEIGDIKITDLDGNVDLVDIDVDSDTSITGTQGKVVLEDSRTQGDVEVKDTQGTVLISANNFNLEDVSVSGSKSLVTFEENSQFTVSLVENEGVLFKSNSGVAAEISKNTVSTEINSNVLEKLSCSDNSPPPVGSGNTITTPDGQCAGF